ncbi:MAG: phage major capsid protein [Flavobacteriales bacterium]|nr:phage major capsid protein [Flavobacteriales bacterium]
MLELRQRQEQTLSQAQAMVTAAETEDRDFTPDEQTQYDGLLATVEQLRGRIGRLEGLGAQTATSTRQAPAVLSIPRGDNETRALAHFFRTGNTGHLGEMRTEMENGSVGVSMRIPTAREMRAVTDSTMNITTTTDGGYAVPTGFVRDVAKRKSEMMLADRLGCLLIHRQRHDRQLSGRRAGPAVVCQPRTSRVTHMTWPGAGTPASWHSWRSLWAFTPARWS